MLQLGDRVRRPHVFLAADAEGGRLAAGVEHAVQHRVVPKAASWRGGWILPATSNTPMPSTWLVVPVKYLSTRLLSRRFEDLRAGVGL